MRNVNQFNKQTCLGVKRKCFVFQRIVQIRLNIYPVYHIFLNTWFFTMRCMPTCMPWLCFHVCPSVSVTGQSSVETSERIELVFGTEAFFDLSINFVKRKFEYLLLQLCPKLWTRKSPRQVHCVVNKTRRWLSYCGQQVIINKSLLDTYSLVHVSRL